MIRMLRHVRRHLALVIFASLVLTGASLAARGDPQRQITPADEARAKAMLVRQFDLPGSRAGSPTPDVDFYCAGLDASDLTLTGDAVGRRFAVGLMIAGSASEVYESRADASDAWRRATGRAGLQCARSLLRRQLAQQGARLISLRPIPFPRLSDRTVAYRATITGRTPQGEITAYVDLIALMRSRAHATITVGSALTTPPRSEELHLARTVAKRMASAMRGA